jgi:SAM-dependent methyltransferase
LTLVVSARVKLVGLRSTVHRARSEHGLRQAAVTASREVVGALRRLGGYTVETVVDLRYGMDTRGIVKNDAVVRGHDGHSGLGDGNYYQAIPVSTFRRIVRESAVRPQDAVFVDIGCGRGRALLLASASGFRRVLGIDLDPGLVREAEVNIGRWQARGGARRQPPGGLQVRLGDAGAVDLPPDDLFLFLFNPFGAATLRLFLAQVEESRQRQPRRITLAYANPVHADVVEEGGRFAVVARGRSWIVFRGRS